MILFQRTSAIVSFSHIFLWFIFGLWWGTFQSQGVKQSITKFFLGRIPTFGKPDVNKLKKSVKNYVLRYKWEMAIDTLKHNEPMLRSVRYKMRNKKTTTNNFINKQANRVCSVNLIFQILNLWAGKWVWRLPGLAFRYSKYWVRLLAPFSRSRKSENKWRNEWINKYISCSKPVSTSSIGSVTVVADWSKSFILCLVPCDY